MSGILRVSLRRTYASKTDYDDAYDTINTFMDNLSGVAEFKPTMSTDDSDQEVQVLIKLKFTNITRATMDTRLTQLEGASGLFPGAVATCRYDETITVAES